MNRLDQMSIKWRLFGYLLIFVAIPVAILWFFQIVFLESFYISIKTQDVKNALESIEGNVDNENLDQLIDRVARQNDISVRLYDSEGNELYASDFGPDNRLEAIDPEQAQDYIAFTYESGGAAVHEFDFLSPSEPDVMVFGPTAPQNPRMGKTIVYSKIIPTAQGDLLLMVNAMITPVNATVRTLRVQLVYITIILLLLSLVIAFLMSRRISRPIIQTNNRAKELAAGNFDTVFDAHGYREIAELNQTLNYTASELSKVEGLRRELIANVSHDLRTPLTLITGYAEMLRDLPGENTPENVQIIIDESSRLSQLVSDMMDISLLQSGVEGLQIDCFNLTQSVRDMLTRYGKLTVQGGYEITFDAKEDVYVDADQGRISQVIYNLINNAVNYTGMDKKVVVTQEVDAETERARINVKDSGLGIAKEDIPYIWDRYYKVDKTHKRAAIGTGLGLSIVRSILQLHSANFGVESERGNGSTFWFELPICPPPADK